MLCYAMLSYAVVVVVVVVDGCVRIEIGLKHVVVVVGRQSSVVVGRPAPTPTWSTYRQYRECT